MLSYNTPRTNILNGEVIMPYRKIGKGKYIEVEKRPMNYDMNLPEG